VNVQFIIHKVNKVERVPDGFGVNVSLPSLFPLRLGLTQCVKPNPYCRASY